jgi:cysteine desulfurase / selenocysteine lyase
VSSRSAPGPALAPRAHFPATQDIVYLDQAAIGLVPTPVGRVMERFTAELGRRGTLALDERAEDRVLDGVREAAARLIGAHADDIAIVSSATEALNQVAWWLRPGRSQNVVLLTGDFPSVVLPWLRLAEAMDVALRLVPTQVDPALATAEAIADLVDEKTAAICVGHVQYATGHRLDLGRLGKVAAGVGARLIVDATQSAGAVRVNVGETPVDALVVSSHKWLCAPHGVAFCYLNPALTDFRPLFVGWRGTVNPSLFAAASLQLSANARRLELGALAYGAALALEAGIRYLDRLGLPRIEEHALCLSDALLAGLTELGADILTPARPAQRASIVAARFLSRDSADLVTRMRRRGVAISARHGALRFSAHVFNDLGEIASALNALSDETS